MNMKLRAIYECELNCFDTTNLSATIMYVLQSHLFGTLFKMKCAHTFKRFMLA